jgi:uncharacterized protein involved in type VI secretion and phage assembly
MSDGQKFYGKYRGIVTSNSDEMFLGRIKAKVPDVLGSDESGWATPCAPFGGDGMGMFCLPKVGAGVWMEFEQGDPDYPIYSGAWWGSIAQVPTDVFTPVPYKKFMIKTEGGNVLTLDDSPGPLGGITLQTAGGQSIKMTSLGIEITFSASQVVKISPTGFDVFSGALSVI